jgi:hypothetical protein
MCCSQTVSERQCYEPLLLILLWLLRGRTVYLGLHLPQAAEKLNHCPAG